MANKEQREDLVKKRGENDAVRYNNDAQLAICKEVKQLQGRIKTKEREVAITEGLKNLKAVTNPFTRLVSSSKEDLATERRAADTCTAIIEAEEKVREHYRFWNHAFGKDLKTLLFEKVCPFLESKANQYLNDLNNGQIKVSFSTVKSLKSGDTKDQFSVTASSTTGSNVFELFSGAEKQLTSFAVGMALSDLAALQTQGASKFMILDEPFLYQSPENCENIVNFITTHKVGDGSTLLLISNEDNLASLIPNRVHVVKRNGVSSIE
jgi:DNA repair exonuclease SbcCD ATPase subunit